MTMLSAPTLLPLGTDVRIVYAGKGTSAGTIAGYSVLTVAGSPPKPVYLVELNQGFDLALEGEVIAAHVSTIVAHPDNVVVPDYCGDHDLFDCWLCADGGQAGDGSMLARFIAR